MTHRRWLWRYALPLVVLAAGGGLQHGGWGVPGTPLRLPSFVPTHLAAGPAGEIWVAGMVPPFLQYASGVPGLWVVGPGHRVRLVAGGGKAGKIRPCRGLACDRKGTLFYANDVGWLFGLQVSRLDSRGRLVFIAGERKVGRGAYSDAMVMDHDYRLAAHPDGRLYLLSAGSIDEVLPSGQLRTLVGDSKYWVDPASPLVHLLRTYCFGLAIDGSGIFYFTTGTGVWRLDGGSKPALVAGSPEVKWGFSGDGGPARQALLWSNGGLALSPVGDLLIADSANCRIRDVDRRGIISTVAGRGYGFGDSDSVPAPQARLNHPRDVLVDGAGTLYIADTGNGRLCRVDRAGRLRNVVTCARLSPH